MRGELPIEVLLACGYAVFLVAIAAVLEKVAKHAQRRTEQYELAGFRYHPGFDRWECPVGNHLVRVETDDALRIVRYRAPAKHCNACHKKSDCTDSDQGREIENRLDLWLQTGLSRFHRGLSLTLLVLAGSLLLVETLRYPGTVSGGLPAGLLVVIMFTGLRLMARPSSDRHADRRQ
jgi:hypothetical protein